MHKSTQECDGSPHNFGLLYVSMQTHGLGLGLRCVVAAQDKS